MGRDRRSARDIIFDMDEDVAAAGGFAALIRDLGTTSVAVEPNGLFVLGTAMEAWAARLQQQWNDAFEATKVER